MLLSDFASDVPSKPCLSIKSKYLCSVTLLLNPASGRSFEVVDKSEGVVQGETPAVCLTLVKMVLQAPRQDLDTFSSMSNIVRPVLSLPTSPPPQASRIVSIIDGASGHKSSER